MERRLVKFLSLMLMGLLLLLSGCSTPLSGRYGAKGLTKEAFTHYVEEVFRLQNSMTSELMALQESDGVNNHDEALLKAEQSMQEACAPLNEYVSRESDGSNTGIFLGQQIEKTATDCEQAAQRVKQQLNKQ
jgi:hypothetical protein